MEGFDQEQDEIPLQSVEFLVWDHSHQIQLDLVTLPFLLQDTTFKKISILYSYGMVVVRNIASL